MKFIFPQNYNFNNKLFGFIDYSTIIINAIWDISLFLILNLFFKNWTIKIFLFITFCFPLLLFSILGLNGENIFYILKYIFKYLYKSKIYVFKKDF